MVGMLIGAMILTRWFTDPQAVAKAMVEMLGIDSPPFIHRMRYCSPSGTTSNSTRYAL